MMSRLRRRALDRAIVAAARVLHARGLVAGTSGNISVRFAGGVRITPSRLTYASMCPRDLVAVALDGTVLAGRRAPSIELPLHLHVYRARADVNAVVHTHSPYATAWSCLGWMPPLDLEDDHYYGTRTQVVPPARAGSRRLADAAAQILARSEAVLLANHGAVAVGASIADALARAEAVEHRARVAWLLHQQAGALAVQGCRTPDSRIG